jgi:hypothetical protein
MPPKKRKAKQQKKQARPVMEQHVTVRVGDSGGEKKRRRRGAGGKGAAAAAGGARYFGGGAPVVVTNQMPTPFYPPSTDNGGAMRSLSERLQVLETLANQRALERDFAAMRNTWEGLRARPRAESVFSSAPSTAPVNPGLLMDMDRSPSPSPNLQGPFSPPASEAGDSLTTERVSPVSPSPTPSTAPQSRGASMEVDAMVAAAPTVPLSRGQSMDLDGTVEEIDERVEQQRMRETFALTGGELQPRRRSSPRGGFVIEDVTPPELPGGGPPLALRGLSVEAERRVLQMAEELFPPVNALLQGGRGLPQAAPPRAPRLELTAAGEGTLGPARRRRAPSEPYLNPVLIEEVFTPELEGGQQPLRLPAPPPRPEPLRLPAPPRVFNPRKRNPSQPLFPDADEIFAMRLGRDVGEQLMRNDNAIVPYREPTFKRARERSPQLEDLSNTHLEVYLRKGRGVPVRREERTKAAMIARIRGLGGNISAMDVRETARKFNPGLR